MSEMFGLGASCYRNSRTAPHRENRPRRCFSRPRLDIVAPVTVDRNAIARQDFNSTENPSIGVANAVELVFCSVMSTNPLPPAATVALPALIVRLALWPARKTFRLRHSSSLYRFVFEAARRTSVMAMYFQSGRRRWRRRLYRQSRRHSDPGECCRVGRGRC